ncbi:hypothetical protein MKX01_022895 [Papaver californicum]|nr:hypothetical protein MKX01_022895 [Papaver californicum]
MTVQQSIFNFLWHSLVHFWRACFACNEADQRNEMIHKLRVQTPTGTVRTHRFATKTAELPAREGEDPFPVLGVLATGDAASGIINPSLPQFISVAAVASVALGTTLNTLVLPQLNRLPQRSVDVVAIKQQLLSQYDILQTRIKNLREATEKEV